VRKARLLTSGTEGAENALHWQRGASARTPTSVDDRPVLTTPPSGRVRTQTFPAWETAAAAPLRLRQPLQRNLVAGLQRASGYEAINLAALDDLRVAMYFTGQTVSIAGSIRIQKQNQSGIYRA